MKRIFIVTILLLLFLSCTKKNIEPTIVKVKVSEIQKNIETKHMNDFTDTVNISVNNKENQESFYNVNSVSTSIQENLNNNYSTIDLLSIIIVDNEIYTLGEEVPKDLKSNFILQNIFLKHSVKMPSLMHLLKIIPLLDGITEIGLFLFQQKIQMQKHY